MSQTDDDLIFDGVNGVACENFIRSIRRQSLAKERQKDDKWVALTAATFLGGPALRWYESLDDDVQESWRLLRRAMLLQWPLTETRPHVPVAAAASAPRNVPMPAAAPPPPSLITTSSLGIGSKIGKIRVIHDGAHFGYISNARDGSGDYGTTSNSTKALLVQSTTSGHPREMMVLAQISDGVRIGVTWGRFLLGDVQEQFRQKSVFWGTLAALHPMGNPSSGWTTSSAYRGESRPKVWNIMMDGEIFLSWEAENRAYYSIDVAVIIHVGHDDHHSIQLTNDFEGLAKQATLRPGGYSFLKVTLLFEPV